MQRLGPAGQHVPLRAHPDRVAARLLQLGPAATPNRLSLLLMLLAKRAVHIEQIAEMGEYCLLQKDLHIDVSKAGW